MEINTKKKWFKIIISVTVAILLLIIANGLKDQPVLFTFMAIVLAILCIVLMVKLASKINDYAQIDSDEEFHILNEQQIKQEDIDKAVNTVKGVGENVVKGSKMIGEKITNLVENSKEENQKGEMADE